MKRPLMGTSNILELQDNGYKSTVSAISEIIDNAIQANAKNIDIIIVKNTTAVRDEIEEILILDDGVGMDAEVFERALQMSSGTRNKAKSGLGKYGQGLPNSSISQAKRVEVYTKKNGRILFNYIDLLEIYNSGEATLPDIELVESINIPLFKKSGIDIRESGTVVRWIKPDRVNPKTAKTLSTHIEMVAGRTYRYFIQGFNDVDGDNYKAKINIVVYDYNGKEYAKNGFISKMNIKAFDPMFLMSNTQMGENPTSILLGEEAKKTFSVLYNGEVVETQVKLRVSYCPRSERDVYGRNAGSTPFGEKYLNRNSVGNSNGYKNISIIRAGREIDSGGFGFIGDVSDPRQRWWSAEIIVEPTIDSIIGIDNKKQQASKIEFIESQDFNNEDVHEISIWISKYLSSNIKEALNQLKKEEAVMPIPPVGGGVSLPPGGESEPGTKPKPSPDLKENEVKREFFEWIKSRYQELSDSQISEMVEYALTIRDNHIFVKSDLGDTTLYDHKVIGDKVLIEINYRHSFYDKFMRKFEEKGDVLSERAIRLLIGSMVNAEIQVQTSDLAMISDRKKIRNATFITLEDYIVDLYRSSN